MYVNQMTPCNDSYIIDRAIMLLAIYRCIGGGVATSPPPPLPYCFLPLAQESFGGPIPGLS